MPPKFKRKDATTAVSSETSPRIMLVDDDEALILALSAMCEEMELSYSCYRHAEAALDALAIDRDMYHLMICDLVMPGKNGIELIQDVLQLNPQISIILVTAHGSTEVAVDALEAGAYDYVTKPINFKELSLIVTRALKIQKIKREYTRLKEQLRLQHNMPQEFVGRSRAIQEVFKAVHRVAKTSASVLITGETGTGKELVARALHYSSDRKDHKFVALNCASIPENLLESELFGHTKGAFTGADREKDGLFIEAQNGTLFLDEVGDMPLALQSKLLRVLQEHKLRKVGSNKEIEVQVRIVAATHKNLVKLIERGAFREDLFFRLNVITLTLPSLRERLDDIPLLCDFFIRKYRQVHKTTEGRMLSREAMHKLLHYAWPGNVRELENTIERAVIMAPQALMGPEDIVLSTPRQSLNVEFKENHFSNFPSLANLEKDYLHYVLNHTEGKREKAAEILHINRKTLYRKILEYGLDV